MDPTRDSLTLDRRGMDSALFATMEFLPRLGAFLLILIVGFFVARFLGKADDRVLDRVGFDRVVEKSGI